MNKKKSKKVLIELDVDLWKDFKPLAKKKYGLVKIAIPHLFEEWIEKNKK